jgi:hypothetical protein
MTKVQTGAADGDCQPHFGHAISHYFDCDRCRPTESCNYGAHPASKSLASQRRYETFRFRFNTSHSDGSMAGSNGSM